MVSRSNLNVPEGMAGLAKGLLIELNVFFESAPRLCERRQHNRMTLLSRGDKGLRTQRGGHKDRRRRLLYRSRQNADVVHRIELPLVRERRLPPKPFDN